MPGHFTPTNTNHIADTTVNAIYDIRTTDSPKTYLGDLIAFDGRRSPLTPGTTRRQGGRSTTAQWPQYGGDAVARGRSRRRTAFGANAIVPATAPADVVDLATSDPAAEERLDIQAGEGAERNTILARHAEEFGQFRSTFELLRARSSTHLALSGLAAVAADAGQNAAEGYPIA